MGKLFIIAFLIGSVTTTFAQSRVVTGTVTDQDDKSTLPGVTVKVGNTTQGTQTNAEGKFSITVPENETRLAVSFVGYITQEVAINGQTNLNIALAPNQIHLNEVIVTALGISRQEKSLGYAAQQIKGSDLSMTRQEDINTSLAGKVAGVQVLGGSGARFGTSTIRIRGINSLQGGNPIY